MSFLEITTTVGCKVGCEYCPQSLYVNNYLKRSRITMMSLETFETCLDKVPSDTLQGVIFSGFSEPFLNPQCTDMIVHCLQRGLPVDVYTTMMGVTLESIDRLSIYALNWVVHLPDNQGLTRIKVDADYFALLKKLISSFEKVAFLYTHGGRLREYMHPDVLAFLKSNGLKFKDHLAHSRAGAITGDDLPSFKVPGKLNRCGHLKINVLLPNGDVALCCQDFGQKHLLGNLVTSDYASLFTSAEFQRVVDSLEDESIDSLCRQCVLHSFPENPVRRLYHKVLRLWPAQLRKRTLSSVNWLLWRASV